MKKIVLLFTIILAFNACKSSDECKPESIDPNKLVSYEGEFIYTADAAVLKGDQFIYGITLDCMAEKLADQVAPVKRDEYDMVEVVIKGVVSKNESSEGWQEIVTIHEIVSVSDTPSDPDVKIEDKN